MVEIKYDVKYIREEDNTCLISDKGLSREAAIKCFVEASEVLNLLEYRWSSKYKDSLDPSFNPVSNLEGYLKEIGFDSIESFLQMVTNKNINPELPLKILESLLGLDSFKKEVKDFSFHEWAESGGGWSKLEIRREDNTPIEQTAEYELFVKAEKEHILDYLLDLAKNFSNRKTIMAGFSSSKSSSDSGSEYHCDFVGRELKPGDVVACIESRYNMQKQQALGLVQSFTPKKINIVITYVGDGDPGFIDVVKKSSCYVVKIDDEEVKKKAIDLYKLEMEKDTRKNLCVYGVPGIEIK